jgi:uncharacterized protein (DUF849 family)
MPLNDQALEAGLIALYNHMRTFNGTPEAAAADYAQKMATLIKAFVMSGTVITTGSATTQTGTIT